MCIFKEKVLLEPYQKAYTSKKFTDEQKKEMFERHSKELLEAKLPASYMSVDYFGHIIFPQDIMIRYTDPWGYTFTKSKNVNLW